MASITGVSQVTRPNLRSMVVARWRDGGSTAWTYERTLQVCLECDEALRAGGHNPAPRFRAEVARGNEPYIRNWVMGCHFDWLKPR